MPGDCGATYWWGAGPQGATSKPIPRPVEHLEERTQHLGASQVPFHNQGITWNWKDLYEEGFSCSHQAATTEFRKLKEPKVAKLKWGYSSNAILLYLSWLKNIQVHIMECHLSLWEAIQMVKDCTSEHAQLEVEYYLGLTPNSEQSFQGLIDHFCLAFQSLIADFYNWSQKAWETEDMFADKLQVLVRKIVAQNPKFTSKANQALKHQFAQNLRNPYFRVVTR